MSSTLSVTKIYANQTINASETLYTAGYQLSGYYMASFNCKFTNGGTGPTIPPSLTVQFSPVYSYLTNGACDDHSGPPFTYSDSGANFTGQDGRVLTIASDGATNHAELQEIRISSVTNATHIDLASDPTDGNSETAIESYYATWYDYGIGPLKGSTVANAVTSWGGQRIDMGQGWVRFIVGGHTEQPITVDLDLCIITAMS